MDHGVVSNPKGKIFLIRKNPSQDGVVSAKRGYYFFPLVLLTESTEKILFKTNEIGNLAILSSFEVWK